MVEVTGLCDFVTGENVDVELADAQVLLVAKNVPLPRLLSQARVTKWSMVWFVAFLGDDHKCVECHRTFLKSLNTNEI